MYRGCLRLHPMKYQRVSWSGCSCSLASLHYVTGVPCMKESNLKWHRDTLGRGRASDVDHSCEHSVHGRTCCYAGGKHLSQSWTCCVSDATADSIWQDGQDGLSECTHDSYKKLSYRRVTARCVLLVVILPIATPQCRNYLYYKSWPNWWYEVGGLVGGNVSWTMCTRLWRDRVGSHCLRCHKQTDDGRVVYITCIPTTCCGEIF